MRKFLTAGLGLMALTALLAGCGMAQEEKVPSKAEVKEESIYGEGLSVNEAAVSMTVQYYDYDTDEEKNLDVVVDKNTKFDNAASLKEVKKGDWVDVSYSSQADKKVAISVIVEREEEELTAPAETEEAAVRQ